MSDDFEYTTQGGRDDVRALKKRARSDVHNLPVNLKTVPKSGKRTIEAVLGYDTRLANVWKRTVYAISGNGNLFLSK